MEGALESWQLITTEKYMTILTALICICNREPVKLLRLIYPQIYEWYKNTPSLPAVRVLLSWHALTMPTIMPVLTRISTWRQLRGSHILRQHILTSIGLMAKTIQRGARCVLVLANSLRTLDANCVSHSPTRAQFVVKTGLLNIELLGLQEAYLGGVTMKENS